MNALAGHFVLVLGLGESGLAMARWCAHAGARLRVADTREAPPSLEILHDKVPAAETVLGAFTPGLLDGVTLVALSPGLDPRMPVVEEARRREIPVTGEMSLFAGALETLGARARSTVVAITGTNGKTTTTALAAAMFRAAGRDAVAAGNISPAALALLVDRLDAGGNLPDCWVLELSSFQLETMQGLNPDAAVVLNLSDDHFDRHGDLVGYAAAKARIYEGSGVQVLNRDDARVCAMALPGRRLIRFGAGRPTSPGDYGIVSEGGERWLVRGDERLLRQRDLRLAGEHNALNALAALALGEAIGCARAPMVDALSRFEGLPHRVALVARRHDGVAFYNDSKGTNVGATLAALQGLGCPVVLIVGGDGKGQDFSPLREAVARHARAVVQIGRDGPLIASALAGLDLPVERAESMEDAVVQANRLARTGDAVLLSPACASFDMFRNYPHRAEVFVDAVLKLPAVSAA
ncbi:MAG: UDP-N-acetylmuramoyl-L-alanine--D-glutamate ligase [Rhodocyclaceae bacterium]|nr:UDP-N-acetylmuramoyl-L-alanine--D-glutamate ligase [Rhodocyclaceae bacterium]MCL4758791.1 UDP-N-acetylmuramoyl-L-alanine--D-glutamate ligase [Rhodocyclaceae bacterium]